MKRLRKNFVFAATTFFAAIILFLPAAHAETTVCTKITTIPTTITAQGIYCFAGNLAGSLASGNAIEIATNNVTIDFNGYKLGNLAAGPSTGATGVYAYNRKNITLRNGTIRGFSTGIALNTNGASSGHLVEDMRMDGNTRMGMSVLGRGVTVRNNQVVDTGGSTGSAHRYGIYIYRAEGATIVNNTVSNTFASTGGTAFGMILDSLTQGSVIKNNRITDTRSISGIVYSLFVAATNQVVEDNYISRTTSTGTRYGVYAHSASTYSTIANNRILGADIGVFCGSTTARIRDNLTNQVTTGYSANCSNQGNNQ